jgi:hypothetical protein
MNAKPKTLTKEEILNIVDRENLFVVSRFTCRDERLRVKLKKMAKAGEIKFKSCRGGYFSYEPV